MIEGRRRRHDHDAVARQASGVLERVRRPRCVSRTTSTRRRRSFIATIAARVISAVGHAGRRSWPACPSEHGIDRPWHRTAFEPEANGVGQVFVGEDLAHLQCCSRSFLTRAPFPRAMHHAAPVDSCTRYFSPMSRLASSDTAYADARGAGDPRPGFADVFRSSFSSLWFRRLRPPLRQLLREKVPRGRLRGLRRFRVPATPRNHERRGPANPTTRLSWKNARSTRLREALLGNEQQRNRGHGDQQYGEPASRSRKTRVQ